MELAERVINTMTPEPFAHEAAEPLGLEIATLGMDSLTFMDRIMSLEELEGVILSDEEVAQLLSANSLRDIVDVFSSARDRK